MRGIKCGNVKRFRGGLVFKADRFLYHSTRGLGVIKKKKHEVRRRWCHRPARRPAVSRWRAERLARPNISASKRLAPPFCSPNVLHLLAGKEVGWTIRCLMVISTSKREDPRQYDVRFERRPVHVWRHHSALQTSRQRTNVNLK